MLRATIWLRFQQGRSNSCDLGLHVGRRRSLRAVSKLVGAGAPFTTGEQVFFRSSLSLWRLIAYPPRWRLRQTYDCSPDRVLLCELSTMSSVQCLCSLQRIVSGATGLLVARHVFASPARHGSSSCHGLWKAIFFLGGEWSRLRLEVSEADIQAHLLRSLGPRCTWVRDIISDHGPGEVPQRHDPLKRASSSKYSCSWLLAQSCRRSLSHPRDTI